MENKGSFLDKLIRRITGKEQTPKEQPTEPKESERSQQSGLQILIEIIPAGSTVEDFKERYNQLDREGKLSDIISEAKKLSPEPLMIDRIGGDISGFLSEEDGCLTIGAEKEGVFSVGIVHGYFKTEDGTEGLAALIRESGAAKPKMWMVGEGSEADEYSFHFGYM